MKPSSAITAFIAAWESLHDGDLSKIGLQPKICPAGYWTEGYGHVLRGPDGEMLKAEGNFLTIESVLPFSSIKSEEQAMAQLEKDLEEFSEGVIEHLEVTVEQHQFDALLSHSYNCGFSETLYRLVNSCAPESEIHRWFTTKYITANGKFLKGLQYRRNDEYEIWSGSNYQRDQKLKVYSI